MAFQSTLPVLNPRVIELIDLRRVRRTSPLHRADRPPRHFWRWELTLWAAVLATLILPAAIAPFFDVRAGRISQAAWEMFVHADHFTPRIAGDPDFSVSPLAALMLTPFYAAFGKTLYAVPALGLFFAVVQLWVLRRLTGRVVGIVGARLAMLTLALTPGWFICVWTDPALVGALAGLLVGMDLALGPVRGAPKAWRKSKRPLRVLREGASIHAWLTAGAAFGAAGLLAMRADLWLAALTMGLTVWCWRGRLQRPIPGKTFVAHVFAACVLSFLPVLMWRRLLNPEQAAMFHYACRNAFDVSTARDALPTLQSALAGLGAMKFAVVVPAAGLAVAALRRRLRLSLPLCVLFAAAFLAMLMPGALGRLGGQGVAVAQAAFAGTILAALRAWTRPAPGLRRLYVVLLGIWIGWTCSRTLIALVETPRPDSAAREAAAWIERQGLAPTEPVGWISDESPALMMFHLDQPWRLWPAASWPALAQGPAGRLLGMRYAVSTKETLVNPAPEKAPAWRRAARRGDLVILERQLTSPPHPALP